MKKTLIRLLAVLLICQLLGVAALAAGEDLCGTWYLVDMDDGSGEDNAEKLAAMNALGIHCTLVIREDGTATVDLFTETHDFTVDFDKGTFTVNDREIPFVLKDGLLTFGDDEMSMTFSKQSPSAGAGEKQPFDYYEFIDMVDADGNKSDIPPELVNLVIREDGTGVLTSGTTVMEMVFDFDKGEISDDEDGKIGTFTLEKDVLTIDDGEYILRFRLGDPGFAGPYILTGMVDADGKDVSDAMGMMSIITLTIGEDGAGALEILGQKVEMRFDFDKMVVTSEDDETPVAFTYENGTLTMSSAGNSMIFRRVLADSSAEEQAPAAEEVPAGDSRDKG